MKKWILKAIVQKTISFLPFGHKVNYLFQKYVTKGVFLGDEYFFDRLLHSKAHIRTFNKYCGQIEGKTTLELGTGWYPVVPISFFLCGAEKIISLDITPLLNEEKLLTTIRYFVQQCSKEKLRSYLNFDEKKWQILVRLSSGSLGFDEMLNELNVQYILADARSLTMIENRSIDLIHSNNVFEHIYADILEDILKEFNGKVKQEGMMSHFIDMSDHFAHFDTSITIYNYLQFSKKAWTWIDNSIQPQNRLRLKNYLALYDSVNTTITELDYRSGDMSALAKVKIHEQFHQLSNEELAISHVYISSFNQN